MDQHPASAPQQPARQPNQQPVGEPMKQPNRPSGSAAPGWAVAGWWSLLFVQVVGGFLLTEFARFSLFTDPDAGDQYNAAAVAAANAAALAALAGWLLLDSAVVRHRFVRAAALLLASALSAAHAVDAYTRVEGSRLGPVGIFDPVDVWTTPATTWLFVACNPLLWLLGLSLGLRSPSDRDQSPHRRHPAVVVTPLALAALVVAVAVPATQAPGLADRVAARDEYRAQAAAENAEATARREQEDAADAAAAKQARDAFYGSVAALTQQLHDTGKNGPQMRRALDDLVPAGTTLTYVSTGPDYVQYCLTETTLRLNVGYLVDLSNPEPTPITCST